MISLQIWQFWLLMFLATPGIVMAGFTAWVFYKIATLVVQERCR